MSIARAFFVPIMRFFQSIISFIQSLCGGGRNKKRMDMDEVPFEVVVDSFGGAKHEERASLLQNTADSWDDDEWDKKEEISEKIEQWRQNSQKPAEQQAPAEEDLFSTLEPTITSARKVVLTKKTVQAPKRNLFEFNEEKVGASSTLGEIDDDLLAWGEDLDDVLKEHREETNRQRQLDHEQRLSEKKSQNANMHIL